MWGNVGRYRGYPRIVGETGGKDFLFAHPSAEADALVAAIIGGGFSYQGKKCSATSRVYPPQSLWPTVKSRLIEQVAAVRMREEIFGPVVTLYVHADQSVDVALTGSI